MTSKAGNVMGNNEAFTKMVCLREGSSLRTADELKEVFIEEACAILDVNPQVDSLDEDNRPEALEMAIQEYESQLNAAGYTTIWNDGFVIYKDLTDGEAEFLNNFF